MHKLGQRRNRLIVLMRRYQLPIAKCSIRMLRLSLFNVEQQCFFALIGTSSGHATPSFNKDYLEDAARMIEHNIVGFFH
jgi:hypothetical protein